MPKIADLLRTGPTFSFELFPPKTPEGLRRLSGTLADLQRLEPSFVSVTYRGGPSSRVPTHELVAGMLRTTTLTPMAHLICSGHTRLELADILVQLRKAGIENLLALGGDPPGPDAAPPGELMHAVQLVELARAVGGFSVGVAAHPSLHPRSTTRAGDRDHLAEKLRLADFAITQSVFDLDAYLGLMDDLADRGVDAPVVPGIMPLTSRGSVARQAELGAVVPQEVAARIDAAADDDVPAVGVDLATELSQSLLDAGAPGLHFITLNRSSATREIYTNLGLERSLGGVTG